MYDQKQGSSMEVIQELVLDGDYTTITPISFAPTTTTGNQHWVGTSWDTGDMGDDYSTDDSDSNLSFPSNNNGSSRKIQSQGNATEPKQRKLPGPRPRRTLEEMTPLEAERRRRRRERNKNAAAKCRQRRLEQTNELLAETEKLEQESNKLEREIENLRRMKNQLEFVLDAHRPSCTVDISDVTLDHVTPPSSLASSTAGNVCVVRPNNLPIASLPATCRSSVLASTSSVLDGGIFSFDTPTSLAGFTPMLMSEDLSSPFILLSPSTLLAQ